MTIAWLGNEESLQPLMRRQQFESNPEEMRKLEELGPKSYFSLTAPEAKMYGFWGDEEDDEVERGIGSHLIKRFGNGKALLSIQGSLDSQYRWYNPFFGIVSYDEIKAAAIELMGDESITEVKGLITTGGGPSIGLPEAAKKVDELMSAKGAGFHVTKYCFSAGMFLTAGSGRLTTSEMAQIGSIGVISSVKSYSEMLKSRGVEVFTATAGQFKGVGNPEEPISELTKDVMLDLVNKNYDFFLERMTSKRSTLSLADKLQWADGKTFLSRDAIRVGLSDGEANFDDIVANLALNNDNNPVTSNLETPEMTGKMKTVETEAQLAAASLGAEVPTEDVETPEGVQLEDEVIVDGDEGTEEGGEQEPEDTLSATPATTDLSSIIGQVTQLSADNAKLEVKLAGVESSLAAANSKAETLQSQLESVMPLAGSFVNRLETALGKTRSEVEGLSPEKLCEMANKLNADFEKSFSFKAKAKTVTETRSEASETNPVEQGFHKITPVESK